MKRWQVIGFGSIPILVLILTLSAVATQAQEAWDSTHVATINRRTMAVARSEYPPSADRILIPDAIQDYLADELIDAGHGDERVYCLTGEWIEPGAVYVRGVSRSAELDADTKHVVPVPCPPEAIARVHLHTAPNSCFWSAQDQTSFKNRVIMFGTHYAFDLVVCWDHGEVVAKAWSWDELREIEDELTATAPVFSHAYARMLLYKAYDLDLDSLYVGRWP